MADSNIQTPDTVKPITLDEYEERTAHLQENTTSLLSAISDRQVQAAGLATQAYSLASEVNAVAEQASLSFSKKTWEDNATSGTPITAAELNRLEDAISNLTTAVNNLQDSVSLTANVLESQTFTDIEVWAQMRSGIVCVNVCRLQNNSLTALTKWNSPIIIGKLKQVCWPSHNYVQYIGTQNGAWLILSVNKKGEVAIFHQHVTSDLHWTYFEGSLSYPIA